MINTLFLLNHLAADLIETCYVTDKCSTIIGFLLIVYPIRPKKRLFRSQTIADLWVKVIKKTLRVGGFFSSYLCFFLGFHVAMRHKISSIADHPIL